MNSVLTLSPNRDTAVILCSGVTPHLIIKHNSDIYIYIKKKFFLAKSLVSFLQVHCGLYLWQMQTVLCL